jgi:hypothetical protein
MSFVIAPDGTYQRVHPQGKYWSLEELQTLVEGYIQQVPQPDPVEARDEAQMNIYVNEEGRLDEMPPNPPGTRIAEALGVNQRGWDDPALRTLVGSVAFIDRSEEREDDEDVDPPDEHGRTETPVYLADCDPGDEDCPKSKTKLTEGSRRHATPQERTDGTF